jgi:hypothetical protein
MREPLPPIVFTRQGNVWRSDGSGSQPRQLTQLEQGSYAEYPTFSPDGGRIAFVEITPAPVTSTLPLPSSTLYVMGADGSGMRALWKPEQGLLGLPTWAPDGQSLLIAANGLEGEQGGGGRQLQVLRLDLATGARKALLADALDPALSRDGKQLAYLKLSQDGYTMSLMVAVPDGSGARELIGGQDFQGFYAPRFSPDGKHIVVAAIGGPPSSVSQVVALASAARPRDGARPTRSNPVGGRSAQAAATPASTATTEKATPSSTNLQHDRRGTAPASAVRPAVAARAGAPGAPPRRRRRRRAAAGR